MALAPYMAFWIQGHMDLLFYCFPSCYPLPQAAEVKRYACLFFFFFDKVSLGKRLFVGELKSDQVQTALQAKSSREPWGQEKQ
jgi:hypothetical protein